MKTKPHKKMSVLLMLAALGSVCALQLVPEGALQAAMENEHIVSVRKKMESYLAYYPEDRVYVQTDKPFYSPGEDIWFSVLVKDGSSLASSKKK